MQSVFHMSELKRAIAKALARIDGQVNDTLVEKFEQYLLLLTKWNAVHNLTGIKDPLEMVSTHLVDSLTVLPYLPKGRIIDVGTGAGLPGIPLALMWPEAEFVCLDSSQKKIHFVEQAALLLQLQRFSAVCSRVEDYRPEQDFDLVISRAFSSLSEFVRLTQHLCQKDGKLLAMKGKNPVDELAALPQGLSVEVQDLKTEGKTRTLVWISPQET